MKAYAPRLLYRDKELHTRAALLVENGRVRGTCAASDIPSRAGAVSLDGLLAPGYVDLQINGCGGVLFNADISLSTIVRMTDVAFCHGVTSILPTLITASDEDIAAGFEIIEAAVKDVDGVVGMHLEGPYLSVERRGTHAKELIRPLDQKGLELICQAARKGFLKLVTVAPESVTTDQLRTIADTGVCIALGHTAASAEEILAAHESGARMLTHFFNGMPPLMGREPGPVGACLASDSLFASLIGDGAHVDAVSVRAVYRAMGDRLFLISDASASEEGGTGTFIFGGHECRIENGVVRNDEGGLAGAAMLLDQVVINTAAVLGDVCQAIFMATELPAKVIGMEDEIGSLRPGCRADFIHLDPDTLSVRGVWKDGETVGGQPEEAVAFASSG